MHRGKEADMSLLQGEGGPEEDVQQSVSFGSLLRVGGGGESTAASSVWFLFWGSGV